MQSEPPLQPVIPSQDWLTADPKATRTGDPTDQNTNSASPRERPHADHSVHDTFRQLLHAFIAFICLFMVVRAVALEPFGVPTGSMAMTLLGHHREELCPRCGAVVVVGQPSNKARKPLFQQAACFNCQELVDLSEAPVVPGDRLLVDKTAFDFRSPRRWEVAVFHCPVDDSKPYVKRVVGLPGEAIWITNGEITANGRLLRKPLSAVRELMVPIFQQANEPPEGWNVRWLMQPLAESNEPPGRTADQETVAPPDVLSDGVFHLDDMAGRGIGLTYRHWMLDAEREEPVRAWLEYNGPAPFTRSIRAREQIRPLVHEFVVSFDLELVDGDGVFAARLGDGADHVAVDLPLGSVGTSRVVIRPGRGQFEKDFPLEYEFPCKPLVAGQSYRVEFAFVDRQISLAVDGEEQFSPISLPEVRERNGVRRPLQLGLEGAHVRLHSLSLHRDIYYRGLGRHATEEPYRLADDEYFMLGDNTTDSNDSREWEQPGVPERDFIGKPFLIHQPMRLGRVTLNGNPQTFRLIDWGRLRWLR